MAIAWIAISVTIVGESLAQQGGADHSEILKYGKLDNAAYDLTKSLPFGYVLLEKIYAQDPTNNLYEELPIGYIARSAGEPADLVVAFRSTENSLVWLQKNSFKPAVSSILPGSGFIVERFEPLYRAARIGSRPSQSIIQALGEIANEGHFRSVHIIGNGFGAIFATLLALDFSGDKLSGHMYVYTFGSPRIGDLTFSQVFNHLVPNAWRIANRFDVLTKVPPPLLFFHVGDEVEVIGRSKFDLDCESDLSTYLNALDPSEPLAKGCLKTLVPPLPPPETFLERVYSFYLLARKYWPLTTVLTAAGTALGSIVALLLLAWSGGAPGVSRNWLIRKSSMFMLAVPGFGRWALFLGYKRRLMANKSVKNAYQTYFGIAADDPDGNRIAADLSGETLHCAVAKALGSQEPVLLMGAGGAGKTTFLARLAALSLQNQLPAPLMDYTPILVSAGFYTDSLIKAITATLRERDGVGLTDEMMVAQLQSGKFLVLFDGLTEVAATDKAASTAEIVRTAQNFDYASSRFIISTRSSENVLPSVRTFQLQPMTWEFVEQVLPTYQIGDESKAKVNAQIRTMASESISPLLFNMTITMLSGKPTGKTITSRASLYEVYCRRLLKVESDENAWNGWRIGLEQVARWFLLETGKRGLGLAHVVLVNRLEGKDPILLQGDDGHEGKKVFEAAEDIAKTLKRLYGLEIEQAFQLLQRAELAGILVGGRRWRFVHDTFEEYFAASCLLSTIAESDQFPDLKLWRVTDERESDFLGVIEFVNEMASGPDKELILSLPIPESWKIN